MASVVCLGELLVDMVSEAADASLQEAPHFLKAPGGAPAECRVGPAAAGASAVLRGAGGR
jgi:fructokinase